MAVVHPAFVAKLPVLIEDKDVRRSLRPIGARHRLRVAVIKVWEGEVTIRGTNLHVVERVADIGVA